MGYSNIMEIVPDSLIASGIISKPSILEHVHKEQNGMSCEKPEMSLLEVDSAYAQ